MKYTIALLALLSSCTEYRTKNYIIRKDAVAMVILDYQKHAALHGTVNNGGDVAVVFKDAAIPVLFMTAQEWAQ